MVSSVSVMFLFLMRLCGVMKYIVGSMCISGQYGLYALCVWQALFQVVYLLMRAIGCSGISLRMEGNREVENRYRLGFGIGNPSVSSHVLCPSSRSFCTCTILFATSFVSIGCSVSYLFILNCKFRLISLYMKM